MNKLIVMIISLLFTPKTFAGWSTSSGEVTNIYSHNGAHVIRTTLSDDICTKGAFWWPADDPDAKDMFALSLAALMSGKKITVVYDPNNLDCKHGGSAKITHMQLSK